MVTLLPVILAVAAQSSQVSPIRLDDVVADLGKDGLLVQLKENHFGTVALGDFKVHVDFVNESKTPGKLSFVNFQQQFRPAKRTTQSQVAEWLMLRRGEPAAPAFFVQVDGTVSVQSDIAVKEDYTRERLVDEILSNLRACAAFKQDFHASALADGWKPFPSDVDHSRKLDAADPTDLRILTTLWGWQYEKGWGSSGSAPWVFPVDVGGREVWLSPTDVYGLNAGFSMHTSIKKPGGDVAGWIKATNERLGWAKVDEQAYPGFLAVRTAVDMSRGLTPREIKEKIEEFARKAGELEKAAAAGR